MRVFVTGSSGFIGFHLSRKLLELGHQVAGFDGMTPYYDVNLKRARLEILDEYAGFKSVTAMLEDEHAVAVAMAEQAPDVVVHLAAQAGVRYSLENPQAYIDSNITGTYNLIEAAKKVAPKHLLFASTSSVYGGNTKLPFSETDRTDFPVSLYAATKRAGESLTHSYSHLFKIPTTCFRFFTVYGPWGRPDMALFKFVDSILKGQPIEIYGNGKMRRDFTYIDDLVQAIILLMNCPPQVGSALTEDEIESASPIAPWRVVNIAGGQPVELMDFVSTIERHLGIDADKIFLPMQKGDVVATFADSRLLKNLINYEPQTPVDVGVSDFVDWYRSYNGV
jgi:UDP-glucuronate 4-epimerase